MMMERGEVGKKDNKHFSSTKLKRNSPSFPHRRPTPYKIGCDSLVFYIKNYVSFPYIYKRRIFLNGWLTFPMTRKKHRNKSAK